MKHFRHFGCWFFNLVFVSALPTAPSYCSKHRVASQGWNYPVPRGEDTMDREFIADLSMQLPYHAPPEGFRMSSDSSSDADSSMTSSTTTEERNNSMDRNRNMVHPTSESNANFKHLTTFNNNLNNQLMLNEHHQHALKLMKKPPRAPHSTPVHRPRINADNEVKKVLFFSLFFFPLLMIF